MIYGAYAGAATAASLSRRVLCSLSPPRSDGRGKLPSTGLIGCRGCEELEGHQDGAGVGEGVPPMCAGRRCRTRIVDAVAVCRVNRAAERRLRD